MSHKGTYPTLKRRHSRRYPGIVTLSATLSLVYLPLSSTSFRVPSTPFLPLHLQHTSDMASGVQSATAGTDGGIYGSPKRDMIGYGSDTPDPKWPGGVSCVVNHTCANSGVLLAQGCTLRCDRLR